MGGKPFWMIMKIKSRVLFGLIVVIFSISGFSLLKRLTRDVDEWRPSDLYSTTNLSRRSTYSVVSSGASASYSGAMPSVSSGASSMFRHRTVSSYAPASAPAYSQLPLASSPLVSSPQGGLYATSSAEFRSFGGGGNVGAVSMSGGSIKSSGSSMANASSLSVSMPSTSMYAYNSNRNTSSASSVELPSLSGDMAMASAQSYAGIGNTTGPRGMNGRKNVPGIGGNEWTGWLDTEWEGGSDDITWSMLRDLYVRMTGDTDFSNEELWNSFLAWFESNQSNDKFGWYWAPISDAIPFVLLLCLAYAFVIYRKTKQAKKAEVKN